MARVTAPADQGSATPAAAHAESKIGVQLTESSPALSDASSPDTSHDRSLSLSPIPVEQRNQAPGIPDRRKSVRPTSRSPSSQSRHRRREARKSRASPLSVSMANMGNAMKLRDEDEDETPGEKSVCWNYLGCVPRAEEC